MNNFYYNSTNRYNFHYDTNYNTNQINQNNKENKKRGYSLKEYNQKNQSKEIKKMSKREYSNKNNMIYKIQGPNRNSKRDIVLECLFDNKRPTFLPETIMDILRRGTARIEFEDKNHKICSSFFVKIELKKKKYNFLITCSHSITKEDINSKKIINVFYGKAGKEKNINIILDKSIRFIRVYENFDVTLIELMKEDNIPDKNYLYPDLNYKNKGFNIYENNQVYTAGFPDVEIFTKDRQMSAGKIIKVIEDNEFEHNCDTRQGSSGSPIIGYNGSVIGIHYGGNRNKDKNYACFLGAVIEKLKKEDIKCLDKDNLNQFNINNFNNIKNFVKRGIEYMGPLLYEPRFLNYMKNFYQDPKNIDLINNIPLIKDNPIILKSLKNPQLFDQFMKKENIDNALKQIGVEPFENGKNQVEKKINYNFFDKNTDK